MATFKCRVVSAREELYSGDVKMLIASGCEGEVGILAGHTPLITLLRPGPMHIKIDDNHDEVIYVQGGVLEVQPHIVTVLADEAEYAANLDEAKLAEARREVAQKLANQSANMDTSAALASLAETVAQLQTIRKFKNRA